MHEQLSKNRVIIELDPKDNISAAITSSTHERKSRCNIFYKNNRVYLKHNSLGDDIPIVIVLKAMGLECDQEIVQLVGSESAIVDIFSGSLEEPYNLGIQSQQHALAYIGHKVRTVRQNNLNSRTSGRSRTQTPEAEAMEILAHVVLNHVPVEDYQFRPKVIYITHIIRRVLQTVLDRTLLDDKVCMYVCVQVWSRRQECFSLH
jgi:DNA-directed RNA polymerase III subunit RPC2